MKKTIMLVVAVLFVQLVSAQQSKKGKLCVNLISIRDYVEHGSVVILLDKGGQVILKKEIDNQHKRFFIQSKKGVAAYEIWHQKKGAKCYEEKLHGSV